MIWKKKSVVHNYQIILTRPIKNAEPQFNKKHFARSSNSITRISPRSHFHLWSYVSHRFAHQVPHAAFCEQLLSQKHTRIIIIQVPTTHCLYKQAGGRLPNGRCFLQKRKIGNLAIPDPGLSDKTWTCGLYHPKVARYQLRHTQIALLSTRVL